METYKLEKDQFILDHCSGKDVLDVGCVNHTLAATEQSNWRHAQLKSIAKRLVGLDYEVKVVKELQSRGWNVIAADAQNFDLANVIPEKFDVVLAAELIEHLLSPGAFLLCAKKHLAPGGVLILTTPHAYGLGFFLQILFYGEERINDDHTLTFSRKNMFQLLAKCGYEVVEFHWVLEDGTFYCPGVLNKIVAKCSWYFQRMVASVTRAAFAKGMIVVARPSSK